MKSFSWNNLHQMGRKKKSKTEKERKLPKILWEQNNIMLPYLRQKAGKYKNDVSLWLKTVARFFFIVLVCSCVGFSDFSWKLHLQIKLIFCVSTELQDYLDFFFLKREKVEYKNKIRISLLTLQYISGT